MFSADPSIIKGERINVNRSSSPKLSLSLSGFVKSQAPLLQLCCYFLFSFFIRNRNCGLERQFLEEECLEELLAAVSQKNASPGGRIIPMFDYFSLEFLFVFFLIVFVFGCLVQEFERTCMVGLFSIHVFCVFRVLWLNQSPFLMVL